MHNKHFNLIKIKKIDQSKQVRGTSKKIKLTALVKKCKFWEKDFEKSSINFNDGYLFYRKPTKSSIEYQMFSNKQNMINEASCDSSISDSESDEVNQPASSMMNQDKRDTIDDKNLVKIITILFMSHRIQAKIFESDTFNSFLKRLRKILPNINNQNQIGLYHLFFIKQEEDVQLGTIIMKKDDNAADDDGSKKKYKRHVKSLSMKLQNEGSDSQQENNVKDFVKPPLSEGNIIMSLDEL